MENKFYTPEISEFSIDFEYEFHGMTTGGLVIMDMKEGTVEEISKPTHKVWSQEKLSLFCLDTGYRSLSDIEKLIGSEQIRVKLLDKDDLKDLNIQANEWFTGFKYSGQYKVKLKEGLTPRVTIIFKNGVRDGSGYYEELILAHYLHIKNKFEFKKLLKQTGIL